MDTLFYYRYRFVQEGERVHVIPPIGNIGDGFYLEGINILGVERIKSHTATENDFWSMLDAFIIPAVNK